MTKINDLHEEWMQKADYREAYRDLAPAFALARAVSSTRVNAGLHSVIAHLESGRTLN